LQSIATAAAARRQVGVFQGVSNLKQAFESKHIEGQAKEAYGEAGINLKGKGIGASKVTSSRWIKESIL
jgi:hypothetical protein